MAQTAQLFSENFSPAIKNDVRRIIARKNFFRTRAFEQGMALENDATGETNCSWREAHQDPATHRWTVRDHLTAPNLGEAGYDDEDIEETYTSIKPVANNVCFMDALALCADFERTHNMSSMEFPAVQSVKDLGADHFKTFAANEGIVFDVKTKMPIPCFNGQLAAGAELDLALPAKYMDIIKKSKGNMMDEHQATLANFSSKATLAGKSSANQNRKHTALVPAKSGENLPAAAKVEETGSKLSTLRSKFALAVSDKFSSITNLKAEFNKSGRKAAWDSAFAGMGWGILLVSDFGITLSIILGFATAHATLSAVRVGRTFYNKYGELNRKPRREFEKAIKKADKFTSKLPDSPFKVTCQEATGNAAIAYRLLAYRASLRAADQHPLAKSLSLQKDQDRIALEKELQSRGRGSEITLYLDIAQKNLDDMKIDEKIHQDIDQALNGLASDIMKTAQRAQNAPRP
jgi:superoxide dismutase